MEQIFIKPCPCCGATAEIMSSPAWDGLSVTAAVRCLNRKCGLRMDKAGANVWEATEKAVNAWNQREEDMNTGAPEQALEELHKLLPYGCWTCRRAYDENGEIIHVCADERNIPDGQKYGECSAEKCPLLTKCRGGRA